MKPMHAHAAASPSASPAPERWSAPRAGRLVVNAGPVWITQQGERDDHLLQAGESLSVAAGVVLWLGPWAKGQPAVAWAFEPAAVPMKGSVKGPVKGLAQGPLQRLAA